MSFAVAERFVSINGEGIRAGELAVFVRFRGCNLDCSYCDTRWANSVHCPSELMSAEEIAAYAAAEGVKNVTLTGGEPLLQADIGRLCGLLAEQGCRVEIETNGSVPIGEHAEAESRPCFTLDYKLPSSGEEKAMLTDNYRYLTEGDAVKFVSGSITDLERAAQIIDEYRLTERCRVYISPVFGCIESEEIVRFMRERKMNDVRLQLQLHKYIWDPSRRGV